jgi:hypothetical protein
MNALAHHHVGQGDTCSPHSHPHFTALRLGALFFNCPKFIGPAVVTDDDARVSHGRLPPLTGVLTIVQSSEDTRTICSCRSLSANTCRSKSGMSSHIESMRPGMQVLEISAHQ